MLTRRAFTRILAAGFAGTAAAERPAQADAVQASPGASVRATRSVEAQALQRFAELTHPDGARATLDSDWRARASAFVATAAGLSDAQYCVEAMRLLAWFKDGHTTVHVSASRAPHWSLRLPLGREVFSDGMYVTSAKEEAMPLLGARVTRVAGTPIAELIRQFAAVWPSAGVAWVHRWSIQLLSSPGFLHAFGALAGPAETPVAIEGIAPDGSTVHALVRPRADGVANRRPLPRRLSEMEAFAANHPYGTQADLTENGRNFVRRMDRGRTVYVSLDRMGADDFGKPFEAFDREITDILQSRAGTRMIIDLRRNGGGDNMLCEPLRKRIGRSRFNAPGALCVLIAPHTFSAAQNLANRLERETFARFIGEPTGSSPNHCGDAIEFNDGHAELPARVSTVRWMDSSPADLRTMIFPDVLVPSTFADFVAGRDPALEAAYAASKNGRTEDRLEAAPWDRDSQHHDWKPFWI